MKVSDLHLQPGKTGDFLLAKLRVQGVGLGSSNLILTVDTFKDPSSNNIPAPGVNGRVVVTSTTIEVGSATIPSGTIATIPITAFNLPQPGAAGFTLTISGDGNIVEFVGALPGDAPFGALLQVNIVDSVVRISDVHGAQGVTGNKVLARLRVKAVGASDGSFLKLTISSFIDVNANEISTKVVDGLVVVPDARIEVGSATIAPPATTADIPIRAFNIPSPGAAGFDLTISGDGSIIRFVGAFPGDPPFGSFFNVNTADGFIAISDLHSQDPGLAGNFLLATIRIAAVAGAGSTDLVLTIDDFPDPTGARINVRPVNGRVDLEPVARAVIDASATSGNEGSPITFSGDRSTPSPGSSGIVNYEWDFGDGTTGNGVQVPHTYQDDSIGRPGGVYTVTLTVTDNLGGVGRATVDITIVNVDPTITSVTPSPGTIDEGNSSNISVSATDVSGDIPLVYFFDCNGDNIFEVGPQTGGNSTECYFNDDSVHTVNVQVQDKDGGSARDSTTVIVNNVPPTIISVTPVPTSGDEPLTSTVTVNATDPGTGDLPDLRYRFDCDGNGVFEVGTQVSPSTNCVYPDGPVAVTTIVQVDDQDGGITTGAASVVVLNADPFITDVVAAPRALPPSGGNTTAIMTDSSRWRHRRATPPCVQYHRVTHPSALLASR